MADSDPRHPTLDGSTEVSAETTTENLNPVKGPRPEPQEPSELAETASSRVRAAAAWWFVFLGPVAVAASALIAGLVGDARDVQLTFVIAVWTVTFVIGLAASPRGSNSWWTIPIAVAFGAALAAAALLYLTQVTIPVADTATTTSTTGSP